MKDHESFERVLATVAELLAAEGMEDAANIVRSSHASVDETGYDNWNGGITLWTVSFEIEPIPYTKLGIKKSSIEEQIGKRLSAVIASTTDDGYSVKIIPKMTARKDWRESTVGLSEVTRRNIIDGLQIDNRCYALPQRKYFG